MSRPRLTLAPAVLLAALAALLVFAGVAAAETVVGESTALALSEGGPPTPEATLVKSAVTYDSAGGTLTFAITTGAEPQVEVDGEPSGDAVEAFAFNSTVECSVSALSSGPVDEATSLAAVLSPYLSPTEAAAFYAEPSTGTQAELPATQTVAGTTTTISATSNYLLNRGFDCAFVVLVGSGPETSSTSVMVFPLAPPPVAPPAPTPPAPTPAPAAFSLKTPKPVQLSSGKWKIVKVKVTNTGATQSVPGTLQVKAPKGVVVRPAKQQLPILAPGGSYTLSVRVKLTPSAKKTSKLSLTGSATGATGVSGSVLLKLKS
jgi:hypothetical protein